MADLCSSDPFSVLLPGLCARGAITGNGN